MRVINDWSSRGNGGVKVNGETTFLDERKESNDRKSYWKRGRGRGRRLKGAQRLYGIDPGIGRLPLSRFYCASRHRTAASFLFLTPETAARQGVSIVPRC